MLRKARTSVYCSSLSRDFAAFTLIELLVCVAIIALLVALLVPALSQAKAKGKTVKCAANLRAIFSSYSNYVADDGSKLLISAAVPESPAPGSAQDYWYVNSGKTPWLSGYYKSQDVCWCPEVAYAYVSLAPSAPATPPYLYANTTSYSFAGSASSVSSTATPLNRYQQSIVEIPQETIFLGDGAWCPAPNGYQNYYHGLCCAYANQPSLLPPPTTVNPYDSQASFVNGAYAGFHGRHNGLTNVAWYDGHVTSESVYVNQPMLLAMPTPPGRIALATLLKEKVGFISQNHGDYTTQFSKDPTAPFYYWISKENQH